MFPFFLFSFYKNKSNLNTTKNALHSHTHLCVKNPRKTFGHNPKNVKTSKFFVFRISWFYFLAIKKKKKEKEYLENIGNIEKALLFYGNFFFKWQNMKILHVLQPAHKDS